MGVARSIIRINKVNLDFANDSHYLAVIVDIKLYF
jgi:hypothetical protein